MSDSGYNPPAGCRVYVYGADNGYWVMGSARSVAMQVASVMEEEKTAFLVLQSYPGHWGAATADLFVRPDAVSQVVPLARGTVLELWERNSDQELGA